ncbi:hypothetical protein ACTFIY_005447 [Dictyostelium cf. discoideum]
MSDPLIVSYNDSAIYQSDINILKSNQWLNDSIISFYFEWLKDGEDNKNKIPNQVLLLSPSVVFCCSFVESEQDIQLMFEQPLSLKTKELIFFPLTNNRDPDVIGGGTHWSLLIFIKSLNKFIYYDSINSFNSSDAIFIISKFKFLLSPPPQPKTNLKEFIINQKTPQQQNGYDCGLYVLSIIEELLKLIIKENENNKGEENKISYKDLLLSEFTNELLFKEITPNYIKDKRVEILNTILKLKKK